MSLIRSKVAAHPIMTGLFCLVLVIASIYITSILHARSRALAGMDRLAKLGMPLSTAEYMKQFETAPSDPAVAGLNSLTTLSRATQLPRELAARVDHLRDGGTEARFLREQIMPDVESYVFANEPAYTQIEKTLAACSPATDYSSVRFYGLTMGWAAELLYMRTIVSLEIHHNDVAMKDLMRVLQIADMLAESRQGVPSIFRDIVLRRAVNGALSEAIASGALSDVELEIIALVLAKQDRGGRIQDCLGEMFARNCDIPDAAIVGSINQVLEPKVMRYTGISQAGYTSFVQQQVGTLAFIGAQWPSFAAYVTYSENCVAAARQGSTDRWISYCNVLSGLTSGNLPASAHVDYDRDRGVTHKLFLHDAQSIAIVRMGRVIVALEQYSRENGEYPTALDQLVPGQLAELPVSPFTRNAFSYSKLEPSGVRVFCIGGSENPFSTAQGKEISVSTYAPRRR